MLKREHEESRAVTPLASLDSPHLVTLSQCQPYIVLPAQHACVSILTHIHVAMKLQISIAALSVLATASAHSWLHCTSYDNFKILPNMQVSINPHPVTNPRHPLTLDVSKPPAPSSTPSNPTCSRQTAVAGRAQSRTQATGSKRAITSCGISIKSSSRPRVTFTAQALPLSVLDC